MYLQTLYLVPTVCVGVGVVSVTVRIKTMLTPLHRLTNLNETLPERMFLFGNKSLLFLKNIGIANNEGSISR